MFAICGELQIENPYLLQFTYNVEKSTVNGLSSALTGTPKLPPRWIRPVCPFKYLLLKGGGTPATTDAKSSDSSAESTENVIADWHVLKHRNSLLSRLGLQLESAKLLKPRL
ncbi:hypothetical protein ACJJTC_010151 [Scirpophaga incertulas]